jgi:hypothetical protein
MRVSRHHDEQTPRVLEATLPTGSRMRLSATVGPIFDADGQFVGVRFTTLPAPEGADA